MAGWGVVNVAEIEAGEERLLQFGPMLQPGLRAEKPPALLPLRGRGRASDRTPEGGDDAFVIAAGKGERALRGGARLFDDERMIEQIQRLRCDGAHVPQAGRAVDVAEIERLKKLQALVAEGRRIDAAP